MDIAQGKISGPKPAGSFFRTYVHALYMWVLAPRLPKEDDRRIEFILNIILIGNICLLTVFELLIIFQSILLPLQGHPYRGVSVLFFSCIYGLSIFLLYLSRKGHIRLVSVIFIGLYFFGTGYTAFRWGPDVYQVILMYAVMIVISTILLGSRFGFGLTALISVYIIGLSLSFEHGFIDFNQEWKKDVLRTSDTAKFACTYLLLMLISWLSNREIYKSLARARASEHALEVKNESLERIVEERTRELRKAQAEKVSRLYHFAEFGKLSSGIFHDLINPLSVVAMNVHELETSLHASVPDIKDYIGRASRASKRMEQFITTVRKQIQMPESEERFLIDKEIKDAVSLLAHKAFKNGVTIKFRLKDNMYTWGNTLKLQHVIMNLISNAIDSYDGLERKPEDRSVLVKLSKKGTSAEIIITDKGSGIPENIISKIFDPFFSTKSREKGMGIGLSNTKDIIGTYYAGTISVQSREGFGTQFTITFPLRKNGTSTQT